jgi:multicomponent Na+:H+ antiporter subunit D
MTTWLVILPILIPFTGAALAILLRKLPRGPVVIAAASILSALGFSIAMLVTVLRSGSPVAVQIGGWSAPFGITLIGDPLSAVMVVMSQIILAAGILYATGCRDYCVQYPGFYPLFLTLTAGLTGAFLAGDLFNLFVFAELMVISGTVLTAIADDRYGVEAAYKYFYMSLLASIFLLLSCGALYVSYGTLNMATLAEKITDQPQLPLTALALVFLLAFFMIKSAVAPFHFWQPDFHTAAPTPVSAMLSSVVVKLGVYGFLRITTLLFLPYAPVVRPLLIVLGCSGVVLGGLGAAGTNNVKRMLAYSTLSQIGFILVGIGWGTFLSLAAALIFTINHSFIKSAMLMISGGMASRASVKSAAFDVLTGLGKTSKPTGVAFFIGAIALVGLPPTNGFISKLTLFQSGVSAGTYLALAVIAIASILTLIYTLRAFMIIWWQSPVEAQESKKKGDQLYVPAALISFCLILGIWAEPLVRLAQYVSTWMGDPALYIRAVIGG